MSWERRALGLGAWVKCLQIPPWIQGKWLVTFREAVCGTTPKSEPCTPMALTGSRV